MAKSSVTYFVHSKRTRTSEWGRSKIAVNSHSKHTSVSYITEAISSTMTNTEVLLIVVIRWYGTHLWDTGTCSSGHPPPSTHHHWGMVRGHMGYTCSHSSALYSQDGTYTCTENNAVLSIKIILHVWDSDSSIAEDSSLQGPGLALRYFRHTGNYLPNRTQHPVDLNPWQSLPQLKSTVFNLLYPTDQLQKNTTNFSTLYIWRPCDTCPLEQQHLWRQYRHHCSELKMALLRKAYMYTCIHIYITVFWLCAIV